MWVKICGTTNLQDALLAVEAGADAVGFVFGPSKRRVTPMEVAAITCGLPANIEKIGVVVNEAPERIAEIVREAGLTGVQLQGDESPELARVLKALPLRLLVKTVQASADVHSLPVRIGSYRGIVETILLDSGSPAERGGTGRTFAWDAVGSVLSTAANGMRVIVAGGLNPSNVAEAISKLHPWGVDVVTGVEAEPGRKNPEKVRAFVAAARAAEK